MRINLTELNMLYVDKMIRNFTCCNVLVFGGNFEQLFPKHIQYNRIEVKDYHYLEWSHQDVIILDHVLEFQPEPERLLNECIVSLSMGGILIGLTTGPEANPDLTQLNYGGVIHKFNVADLKLYLRKHLERLGPFVFSWERDLAGEELRFTVSK